MLDIYLVLVWSLKEYPEACTTQFVENVLWMNKVIECVSG